MEQNVLVCGPLDYVGWWKVVLTNKWLMITTILKCLKLNPDTEISSPEREINCQVSFRPQVDWGGSGMLEAKEVYSFLLFVNGWLGQLFTPCSQPVLLSTSSLNTQQVREICRCNICVFTTIMTCQLGYYAQAMIHQNIMSPSWWFSNYYCILVF